MSRLPRISGRECVKTLAKVGFYKKRQHGSHIILRRDTPFAQLVVPDHKELDRGTLRSIIRQAELDVNEFVRLCSA
ncbi:type II toxin-antitoxin system HicA family toxin [Candidatus Poribacteria bacterium]|nr:type II toxin-antitoxin system HicA family toxin [Candidatus Poribacteria bacterium]